MYAPTSQTKLWFDSGIYWNPDTTCTFRHCQNLCWIKPTSPLWGKTQVLSEGSSLQVWLNSHPFTVLCFQTALYAHAMPRARNRRQVTRRVRVCRQYVCHYRLETTTVWFPWLWRRHRYLSLGLFLMLRWRELSEIQPFKHEIYIPEKLKQWAKFLGYISMFPAK